MKTNSIKSNHNINALPKWAQDMITELEVEIERRDGLVAAHALLMDPKREWFTITNRGWGDGRHIYLFNKDHPVLLCSISDNDTLLIRRAQKANMKGTLTNETDQNIDRSVLVRG